MKPYFTPAFNAFFVGLAANNHKEWFDAHRQRYHDDVKIPFEGFIRDLIQAISPAIGGIDADPRPHIFRINRDIRFSNDKTPYKLQRSAYLSAHGKKDPYFSGFYLQFGPEHLFFGGGVFQPNAAQLLTVRRHMANHWRELERLLGAKDFRKIYGGLSKAGLSKRINDKDLMAFASSHPLLLQKQFFFETTLPAAHITSGTLLGDTVQRVEAAAPVIKFLSAAFEQD